MLCREVLFYRPVRGRDAQRAIWDSHRAVAQDALAKGFARILVLEDDVLLHLWCRSTLRRSHGRTVFAGASADSRMGAPTRQQTHPPDGNRRDRLEHFDGGYGG
jgi:hypothetical protein